MAGGGRLGWRGIAGGLLALLIGLMLCMGVGELAVRLLFVERGFYDLDVGKTRPT